MIPAASVESLKTNGCSKNEDKLLKESIEGLELNIFWINDNNRRHANNASMTMRLITKKGS